MTTKTASTAITDVDVSRIGLQTFDLVFPIRKEFGPVDYAGPTFFDFVFDLCTIFEVNAGPALFISKEWTGWDFPERHENCLTLADIAIPQHLFMSALWDDRGLSSDAPQLPLVSAEYLDAHRILNGYFGTYAHDVMEAVSKFAKKSWQPDLYRLLSGLASATSGKFRPVVSINLDDEAFELEARISATAELFFELDSDGLMEVVLRSDQRGVEEIDVQTVQDLLTFIRREASAPGN